MTLILFDDIHNHNALGYGQGSLERSIAIAKSHLDFFGFTGHSSWHDIPEMEADKQEHWLQGFRRHKDAWPTIQNLIEEAYEPSVFSAFLGFEWHSSAYGDQCVIFPTSRHDLPFPGTLSELRAFCVDQGAIMIPHHIAYATGHRGVNWSEFREDCSPVVEIFSEHGLAEDDRGPNAYFSHSMGGRITRNTVEWALKQGLRFGFVASSDDHSGFPGAFDQGLLAVDANGNNRDDILDAIRRRRTYALTGDRIQVSASLEGNSYGQSFTGATR